jgi:hypothetical protein
MRSTVNRLNALLPTLLLAACAGISPNPYELGAIPDLDSYCLDAQRVVTRTTVPMELVVHPDFDAFVKSKAVIEGPTIHQYNWLDTEGNVQGISCKMKSADHLNMEFGAGSAGPDGLCHDMNRQVYGQLTQQNSDLADDKVVFDLSESIASKEQSNMIGPVWLLPFTLTYLDDANELHVATKGFVIDFNDPRYQKFPASWRGTHYCHFIAPDYLAALLQKQAQPGAIVGRKAKRGRDPTAVAK